MSYELIKPNIRYIDSYMSAISEGSYSPMQGGFGIVKAELVRKDPQSFIDTINSKTPIRMDYEGQQYFISDHELFWMVSSTQFIGSVAMRYDHNCPPLTEAFGHIGLSARPNLVNKGSVARWIIWNRQTVLSKFKDKGFNQITMSCVEDNVPSRRVIERAGGIFDGKKELTMGNMLIFKLNLA